VLASAPAARRPAAVPGTLRAQTVADTAFQRNRDERRRPRLSYRRKSTGIHTFVDLVHPENRAALGLPRSLGVQPVWFGACSMAASRLPAPARAAARATHHGAAAIAAASSEVASWSVSSRAIGRSSAEWNGASPSSTSGRADAATPTLPSGTSMVSKC
jgi:hypothetical protein